MMPHGGCTGFYRQEYVKTLGEVDKENKDLCTAANQVYSVALQAEMAQFIGQTWAVQLGNMTTDDGLKQISKEPQDYFLLEDDTEQFIDDYIPEHPEEEEMQKSPEQAPLPPGFKMQEVFDDDDDDDDDVVVTRVVKTEKEKQKVEEPAQAVAGTVAKYWQQAEEALNAQMAEIEIKRKEAQLDADSRQH